MPALSRCHLLVLLIPTACASSSNATSLYSGTPRAVDATALADVRGETGPVIITGMDTGTTVISPADGGSGDATAPSMPDTGIAPDGSTTGSDASTTAPDSSTPLVDAEAHETGANEASTGDAGTHTSPDASTGGGGVPTTCAEADEGVGCCGANGKNYFCEANGVTVGSTTCTGSNVCTWSETDSEYTCGTGPAKGDPSGTYPLTCGSGASDAGTTGTDSGTAGGGTPTTCSQADDTVGCCGANGDNYFCASGSSTVTDTTCPSGKVCGWNSSRKYYSCVTGPATADPSGTYPIACE